MLSSFLGRALGAKTRRQSKEMLRRGITLFLVGAFLHGQMSWSAERLKPGAPLSAQQQPAAPPSQPGEVKQPPAQSEQKPPIPEGGTTVVTVPVPKETGLDITVVEGDGGANVVGKKSSTRPLVQVRDEKNQLLEGAIVTFIAPADGPSLVFGDGLRTVTVMTDGEGRARAPTMRAVNGGSFRLEVSASFRGQMVSTSIGETNYESASEAKEKRSPEGGPSPKPNMNKGGLSGTAMAIIIGAGAAAAVGIGVGLGHKGSSSSTATTTTSATIGGPGTPTVTGPH